jgi:WD40 repeat protein
VVSAGADGTLRLWETTTGKELHLLRVDRPIAQLAFMADGQRVVATASGGTLAIWHPETGTTKIWGIDRNLTALSRDGRQLVHLAHAEEARVVDPASGREIFALRKHAGPITHIAFSADGTRIATASKDRTVKVWTAGFFELDVQELSGHVGEVFAVVYSPDGKQLASGGADGTVQVRDAPTGQGLLRMRAHAPVQSGTVATDNAEHVLQGTTALAYSGDSRRLASGGADGMVRTWDAQTGKLLCTIRAHGTAASGAPFRPNARNAVTGVAFSPDGLSLASSSWDRTVKLWDATTGKLLHTLNGHGREATRVAFSPDGKLLASSSWDQTIRLWGPATGTEIRSLRWLSRPGYVDPIDSLAFHPDGKYLAAAPDQYGPGGEVKVFDLETGSELHSLGGHIYGIFQVVFSADGRRLASCSCDGGVKIWDMATGQELFTYHNHTGLPPGSEGAIDTRRDAVHSVALSPDGLHLALGCRNSNVLVLDATPETPQLLVARESSRLVRSLYDKWVSRSAVLEHLANDSLASPALRDETHAQAEHYHQDPDLLNEMSWTVVSRLGQPKSAYQRALLQAHEAYRLAPDRGDLLNTLGVARYRAGEYRAALEVLTDSDKIQSVRFQGSHPADLAFLAMAHHQLGEKAQAEEALGRLREAMKQPRWSREPETRAFAQEAESLFRSKSDGLNKKSP